MPKSTIARIGMALTAALVAVAVGVAVILATGTPQPEGSSEKAGGKALIGGPFTLVDHTGETRTEADFRGRPMLVFFGYTHCPDVCPTGLQTMSDALDRLGPLADRIQPLFITIDPARDTAEEMGKYIGHFHPDLVGLTGTPEQVAKAAKSYRVYYAKQGEGEADYLMDHSTFTYLMDAEGGYVTHFNHGVSADEMARRIREKLGGTGS
jgi:protein SCO1/2